MQPVHLVRHGTVSVITVDSPPVNALSHAVREGLVSCFDEAESDADSRAILLHCAGRTFIAGADIREFDLPPRTPHLPDVIERIENCRKPVVAAIHGTALGGGLEVAMSCHYRIADRNAALGLPEVKLGLLPGATGTQRLPRLIGAERALGMMLSGDPVSADEAKDAGLVDRITNGDLFPQALQYAEELRGSEARRVRDRDVPPVDGKVFAAARQQIARRARGLLAPELIVCCVELSTRAGFDEGCKLERRYFQQCRESPQAQALRHAFLAERAAGKPADLEQGAVSRNIGKVAVIGAGTMGAGIAYSCLLAGLEVHLLDRDEAGLNRGAEGIEKLLDAGVERGKLDRDARDTTRSRLHPGTEFDDVREADLVIEAVFENMRIKKDVFRRLDAICKPGAILATNTSTLDVNAIASATGRPADVIGLHFFSPAHVMRLIEIVRGAATSVDVVATALALSKKLNKIGVVVGNCFGFVGNRMLYSYGRENQLMLLEGAAPEYIDRVLTDWGMAMGPNAVGDLAGLDVGYRVRQERQDLPDDPRFYRVADLLAERGRFGQKTGAGIYRYEQGLRTPLPDPEVAEWIREEARRLGIEQREIGAQEIIERCVYGLVTEGARILEEGISLRSSDIDVIWINGYGFPRHRGGPMHYADSLGLQQVYARVSDFEKRFGSMYWTPPDLLQRLAETGEGFGTVGA